MKYLDMRELGKKLAGLTSDKDSLESEVEEAKAKVAEAQLTANSAESDDDAHDDLATAQKELTEAEDALADWQNSSEGDEYNALVEIEDELENHRDETAIPEQEFKDYAQQLAEDLGLAQDTSKWPFTCIDWDKAAEELKPDYVEFDYDGVTYLVRG